MVFLCGSCHGALCSLDFILEYGLVYISVVSVLICKSCMKSLVPLQLVTFHIFIYKLTAVWEDVACGDNWISPMIEVAAVLSEVKTHVGDTAICGLSNSPITNCCNSTASISWNFMFLLFFALPTILKLVTIISLLNIVRITCQHS